MQIGSLVETVGDFEIVRKEWGFAYPKRGDILTVCAILKHPVPEVNNLGIVLLRFDELQNVPPLCDKTVDGEINFVELLLPEDVQEIFKVPMEMDSMV